METAITIAQKNNKAAIMTTDLSNFPKISVKIVFGIFVDELFIKKATGCFKDLVPAEKLVDRWIGK